MNGIKKNISVYILCGGKSTRMQEEKGLVFYKNQPFVQHIIQAVMPITDKIFLVTFPKPRLLITIGAFSGAVV